MPFSKCIDKDPTKHPENDFYTRETCREFDYAQDDFHFDLCCIDYAQLKLKLHQCLVGSSISELF